jgi:putative toxin-antitoxin system antitoxin component (TIGR02293 family)
MPDISPVTVQRMAETVFESREIALKWLERPVNALGGEVPNELLRTPEGCRRVCQVLAKIEAGDFS